MSRGRRTLPLGCVPAVPTGWLWQGSCFGGHSPVVRGGRACPGWVAAPPGYSRSGAPVPHGGPSHTPLQARPEPRAAWPEKPPCRTGVPGVASGPLFPAKTHRALRRPRGPRTPGPVGPAAVSWKAAVRLSAARPFPCAWPSVLEPGGHWPAAALTTKVGPACLLGRAAVPGRLVERHSGCFRGSVCA